MLRWVWLLMSVSFGLSAPIGAQRLGPEPAQKRLAFVADTNDANALYEWGLDNLDRDPASAASAFYWAARINPSYAEPLYARRAAMMLDEPITRARITDKGAKAVLTQSLQLDSLMMHAMMLNPLLYQRFERDIIVKTMKKGMLESARGASGINAAAIDIMLAGALDRAGPDVKAAIAYNNGEFTKALSLYAKAMKDSKVKEQLRANRARIFGMLGEADSAIAEFQVALAEMRAKEQKTLFLYNSKAVLEFTVGTLFESKDDIPSARAAYERALQEDLSYAPAHLRLGLVALSQRDTVAALNELELATQVAADDPYFHYVYGFALTTVQQLDKALEQLDKAVELEPLYALPHAIMGQIWTQRHNAVKAATAYEAFLARASLRDPQRPVIEEKLADVKLYIKPPL